MLSRSPLVLTLCLLLGMASLALSDNYFKNADFKEGSQMWHGDGKEAFLKADGTEGSEGDAGVTPVIRLGLSHGQPHNVYQEIQSHDAPNKLKIKVEVYASIDFKRSQHSSDYVTDDLWPAPNNDFAIRVMPDYFQQTFDLKPGQWVTLEATLVSSNASDLRAFYFMAPPGEGVVYIKNPSVTP